MALPRALQEQLDQANATLEAMNKPPEPAPAAEPAAEPVAQVADPEPTPEPAPAAPEPQAPVEPAQSQQQPDVWEHKYKTLQGLFNREVPTLQNKVKDLEAKLTQAVERLNAAADAQTATPQAPAANPQDVENFGQDLVDMVARVSRASLGDVGKVFEQRLARIEEALKGTTQQVAVTAEQSFFDRLAKAVPDWEAVNINQGFLVWLNEIDPILGQPRQAALDAAQQSLNADRAIAVFNAYKATLPQPTAPKASSPVDKQVSPKGSAATPAPQQNTPKIWTQQEVVNFYAAKRQGEFRGREAEAQALEAQINQAMAEGRIR